MGLFTRNRNKSVLAPEGVSATPQGIIYSAPFAFDGQGQPAHNAVDLKKGGHVSLLKGFEAAEKALEIVELSGIRFQVIVLVDGSGSMGADYQPKFDGRPSNVEQMLLRTLAFTLTVDKDGSIPVIVYGGRVNQAVDVNLGNYGQIRSLIQPDFGWTSMGAAFEQALQIAAQPNGKTGKHELTLVVNITDGNPTDKDRMNRAVVRSSGMPVMLKNLAIRPVDYLGKIDDLASQYQIQMQTDASGNKILDQYGNEIPVKDGNDRLVIDRNPQAARLLDNVDSQTLDPHSADDEEFAAKLAAEIPDCLEVMARVGTLTDVPDIPRIF